MTIFSSPILRVTTELLCNLMKRTSLMIRAITIRVLLFNLWILILRNWASKKNNYQLKLFRKQIKMMSFSPKVKDKKLLMLMRRKSIQKKICKDDFRNINKV